MSSPGPRTPKSMNWFALALVLVVLGGVILVIYALQRTRGGSTSPNQGSSQFYTQAALTVAALQGEATSTSALPPADTATSWCR